jgi:hypothetical protein
VTIVFAPPALIRIVVKRFWYCQPGLSVRGEVDPGSADVIPARSREGDRLMRLSSGFGWPGLVVLAVVNRGCPRVVLLARLWWLGIRCDRPEQGRPGNTYGQAVLARWAVSPC